MYKPDEECKIIIENIQLICRIKGIKANELAKKADIAPSTISYILNGKTKPQIYTLFQLCNALEITLEELMRKRESTDRSKRAAESSCDVIEKMEIDEALVIDGSRLDVMILDILGNMENSTANDTYVIENDKIMITKGHDGVSIKKDELKTFHTKKKTESVSSTSSL